MDCHNTILTGLKALSLPAQPRQIDSLVAFLSLLARWNRVVNLTAVDRPADMIPRHLMDSLAVSPFLEGQRILDVGSGAGLPGIPLAVLNPQRQFTLLDSNGKKTRFMTQARIELGLTNVEIVHSRIEDFDGQFDHVISRAFTSLEAFVSGCSRLLVPGGSLLAMKGPAEAAALPGSCQHRLTVPGLEAERYLVTVQP